MTTLDQSTFKRGEVVQLMGGGLEMTVRAVNGDHVECEWQARSSDWQSRSSDPKPQQAWFRADALKRVP